MSYKIQIACALAAALLSFVALDACTADQGPDPVEDAGPLEDAGQAEEDAGPPQDAGPPRDAGPSEQDAGVQQDAGAQDAGVSIPIGGRFFLIRDLSSNPNGPHPGADLASVNILKADTFDDFFGCDIDTFEVTDAGPRNLQGALGGFDLNCDTPDNYTSLGGGAVIVHMQCGDAGTALGPGDSIFINECDAPGPDGGDDDEDAYEVFVSTELNGDYVKIGESEANGFFNVDVPE